MGSTFRFVTCNSLPSNVVLGRGVISGLPLAYTPPLGVSVMAACNSLEWKLR